MSDFITDDDFNQWTNKPEEVKASGNIYYVLHETGKRMLSIYFDDWEYMFNMPPGTRRGVIRFALMAYNQAYRKGFADGQDDQQKKIAEALGLS